METCLVSTCRQEPRRRGWCGAHYQRWLKYGDPLQGGPRYKPRDHECSVQGCEAPVKARGYCSTHYQRANRGKPMEGPSKRTSQTALPCTVAGCERNRQARNLCQPHYRRWQKTGDPLKNPPRKKRVTARGAGPGQRSRTKQGYINLYWPEHPNSRPDGKVLEHTVVMSEHIGRPLATGENVHHRNGVRDDNRVENLELWNKVQPAGKRVSDLIEYANEIIALYGRDPSKYR